MKKGCLTAALSMLNKGNTMLELVIGRSYKKAQVILKYIGDYINISI